MDIEKNDVDLSKLFTWSKTVPIYDESGSLRTTVYLRVVGDAEVNKARVFALRESAKLRRLLKTPGTDEQLAFISNTEIQEKKNMIKSVVLLSMMDLSTAARKEVDIKFPTEPSSDSTMEEQEKYQEELDNFPEKFNKEVEKLLRKKLSKLEKELEAQPEEQLRKQYLEELIGYICNNRMSEKFLDMCIYFGTFKDKRFKKRSFESFESYDNSPKELKDLLKEAYQSIEINIPDLKKSLEATL
jgi:hypothetical protein